MISTSLSALLLLLYRVIWWSIHQPHRQLPSLCRAAMLCATVQSAMDNAPQRLISAGIRSITCLLTRPPLAFSSAIRCGSSPRAEVLLPALPLLLGKSILERKQSECVWPCSNSVGCREFITSALFVWPPGFPLSIMCPRLNNSELQCCTIFLQLTWFSTDLFLNKMKHMIDWLIDWLMWRCYRLEEAERVCLHWVVDDLVQMCECSNRGILARCGSRWVARVGYVANLCAEYTGEF